MTETHRRRLLIVGPGLVAALVAVALVAANRWQPPAPPAAPLPPPTQDREALLPPVNSEGISPEPAWLLNHVELFSLTAEQRQHIQELQAAFERDTAADRQALDQASAAFVDYMKSAQANNKIDPAEVKRRNAASGPLSARVAKARQESWAKVDALLTPKQRGLIDLARRARPFELR